MVGKNGTASAWPPSSGLTTVNVPRKDIILTSSASVRIHADASTVFEALVDVSNYGQWNTFCPRVTVHSQPDGVPAEDSHKLHVGTSFTFYVIMNSSKPQSETPTQLKVTDISTPSTPSSYIPASTLEAEGSFTADLGKVYRISWKCEGGFVSKGLRTERFHEVIAISDKECEVRTWECQGGLLARTVKWMYKDTLMEKFKLWCDDLKKYCEDKSDDAENEVGT